MKTESGALAIGQSNSAARFASEASHAMENQYQLLLITNEGRELLKRFAKSVGSDFTMMDDVTASNWIDEEHKALFSFLAGVTYHYSKL